MRVMFVPVRLECTCVWVRVMFVMEMGANGRVERVVEAKDAGLEVVRGPPPLTDAQVTARVQAVVEASPRMRPQVVKVTDVVVEHWCSGMVDVARVAVYHDDVPGEDQAYSEMAYSNRVIERGHFLCKIVWRWCADQAIMWEGEASDVGAPWEVVAVVEGLLNVRVVG